MKLLIVEDEPDLLSALKKGFVKRGFAVDVAQDGEEGAYLAQINSYDVIILDLNLPRKDGLELLEEIRERDCTQKIIILSARASVPDKILGLDMGANDYLAKPFDFLELEARVRSLVRRDFTQSSTRMMLGELQIDTAQSAAFVRESKVELAPKEYAILQYLALHRNRVVSAEELMEHVWDSQVDVFTGAVKVHISTLRKKLKETLGYELVETVRGSGYIIKGEST